MYAVLVRNVDNKVDLSINQYQSINRINQSINIFFFQDDGGEDIDGISVQIQNNKSAKAVAARLAGKSKEAPGQAGWRTCVIVTCIVLLVGLGVGIGVVYGLGK